VQFAAVATEIAPAYLAVVEKFRVAKEAAEAAAAAEQKRAENAQAVQVRG